MKLYGFMLFHKSTDSVSLLKTAFDLPSFSFAERRQLRKFICDIGEFLIEHSDIPSRSSLDEQEYFLHCSVRQNGLCVVLATDIVYEERTVFRMLEYVLNDVTAKVPAAKYKATISSQKEIDYNDLPKFLKQWQDVQEIEKLQSYQDSNVTEILLHNSVVSLFESKVEFRELAEEHDES